MAHQEVPVRRVITICPEESIQRAAELMCQNGIGALIVTDDEGGLLGILSERDVINRVTAAGTVAQSVCVRDVMTADPLFCTDATSMPEAQELMARNEVRHLPVVDGNGRTAGMISSRDAMAYQVHADRARRTAAEQVAMLATGLKNLDFDEVSDLVAREVPKVFGAERNVLFFATEGESRPLLVNRCCCPCCDAHLAGPCGVDGLGVVAGEPPACCREIGARGKRVVIPLEIPGWQTPEAGSDSLACGFLCMCGLAASAPDVEELLCYKASLIQGILNSNLTSARHYQQARSDALTDSLTGVGSRRLFEKQLEQEFRRAARYNRPFCVAMLDLDDLKNTNTDGGHAVGDEVLRRFAQAVSQAKRDQDVLCRYGGDEFVLLMPETDLGGAMQMLERVRRKTPQLAMPNDMTLYVSGGVTQYDPNDETGTKALVRCADLALYEAKRTGRDRIVAWRAEDDGALSREEGVDSQKIADLQTRLSDAASRSQQMLMQSMWALVHAITARDHYTRGHSDNVVRYAVALARRMGLDDEQVAVIRRAAMVHDIGKIGVPDNILGKHGPLSDKERRIMERHPLIGVRILDRMRFLERELPLVRHHHERWDGGGYPDGLLEDAIPPGARILAVADAFDAITSDRVYRGARSVPDALALLAEEAGNQFAPDVVEAMLSWADERRQQIGPDTTLAVEHLLNATDGAAVA